MNQYEVMLEVDGHRRSIGAMLPDEENWPRRPEGRDAVYAAEAERVHLCAVRLLSGGGMHIKKSRGIRGSPALRILAGLLAKGTKQHRAVQLLAQRGYGDEALGISRSLFETTIAVGFLVTPRLILRNIEGKKYQAVKGKPLHARFRAKMFLANLAFERERMYKEHSAVRGLKRRARGYQKSNIPSQVAAFEKLLGPEWTKRLKRSRNYSGVSLKELAYSLGLGFEWATHYRQASWPVHAADVQRHVHKEPGQPTEINLSPSHQHCGQALGASNVLLASCFEAVDHRLGCGWKVELDCIGIGQEAAISSQPAQP